MNTMEANSEAIGYTIQQVTDMTGLSAHTLRYYEKAELIRAVKRDASGYRLYSEPDIAWLRFLIRLRNTGMPIQGMKRFAELRYLGDETVRERREMLERHQQQIVDQIEELNETLAALQEKTDHYKALERRMGVSPGVSSSSD